jgi:hypothetical protein
VASGPKSKQIRLTTAGAVVSKNPAGQTVEIPPGTAGHVLTSNGPGALPSYQAAGGGGSVDPREIFRLSMLHQVGG